MNTIPLFKSHYSLTKSILTLENVFDKKGQPNNNSIFNILKENSLDTLVLVDDNLSGLLEASQNANKNNINLYFGLRITVLQDASEKTEESLKKEAKYIIFIKNYNGYKRLIKIWSKASTDFFYYQPRIDFKTLKEFWDDKDLKIAIPMYDSFLHLNSLIGYAHFPDFKFIKNATLFEENNDLPFDFWISKKINEFSKEYNLPIQKTQSIFYKEKSNFIAYLAFRALGQRTSIEKPNLDHMASDGFCFEKWKEINE